MISRISQLETDELATEELPVAELGGRISGGDQASHGVMSNRMRAVSDTQNYIVSNLTVWAASVGGLDPARMPCAACSPTRSRVVAWAVS